TNALGDISRIDSEKASLGERLTDARNSIGGLEEQSKVHSAERDAIQAVYKEAQAELSARHTEFQQAQRKVGEFVIERNKLGGEAAQIQARLEESTRRGGRIDTEVENLHAREKKLREDKNEQSIAHETALRKLADAEQVRRE